MVPAPIPAPAPAPTPAPRPLARGGDRSDPLRLTEEEATDVRVLYDEGPYRLATDPPGPGLIATPLYTMGQHCSSEDSLGYRDS